MRMIVMFDLPTETLQDKRDYRKFRALLLKNGFYMMQESIYTRMVLNPSVQHSAMTAIKKGKPSQGTVQILTVTEKQFSQMEYLVGEYHSEVVDSDERLVIL